MFLKSDPVLRLAPSSRSLWFYPRKRITPHRLTSWLRCGFIVFEQKQCHLCSLCQLTFSCPMSSCFVCNIPLNRCLSGCSCMQAETRVLKTWPGPRCVYIYIYIICVYYTTHLENSITMFFLFSIILLAQIRCSFADCHGVANGIWILDGGCVAFLHLHGTSWVAQKKQVSFSKKFHVNKGRCDCSLENGGKNASFEF